MVTKQLQELMDFFWWTGNGPALKMRWHRFIAVKKRSVHSSYLQRGGGGGCKEKPCSEELNSLHTTSSQGANIFYHQVSSLSLSLSLSLIRSHTISPPNPSWAKNTKHHNKVHRLVVTWWELVGVGLLMITRRSELATFKVQPEGAGVACLLGAVIGQLQNMSLLHVCTLKTGERLGVYFVN
jgi:hypothetical protein